MKSASDRLSRPRASSRLPAPRSPRPRPSIPTPGPSPHPRLSPHPLSPRGLPTGNTNARPPSRRLSFAEHGVLRDPRRELDRRGTSRPAPRAPNAARPPASGACSASTAAARVTPGTPTVTSTARRGRVRDSTSAPPRRPRGIVGRSVDDAQAEPHRPRQVIRPPVVRVRGVSVRPVSGGARRALGCFSLDASAPDESFRIPARRSRATADDRREACRPRGLRRPAAAPPPRNAARGAGARVALLRRRDDSQRPRRRVERHLAPVVVHRVRQGDVRGHRADDGAVPRARRHAHLPLAHLHANCDALETVGRDISHATRTGQGSRRRDESSSESALAESSASECGCFPTSENRGRDTAPTVVHPSRPIRRPSRVLRRRSRRPALRRRRKPRGSRRAASPRRPLRRSRRSRRRFSRAAPRGASILAVLALSALSASARFVPRRLVEPARNPRRS